MRFHHFRDFQSLILETNKPHITSTDAEKKISRTVCGIYGTWCLMNIIMKIES